MNDDRVSKKQSITTTCVAGVLGMAASSDDPLPFAIIIGSMFALYMVTQVLLDWFKN